VTARLGELLLASAPDAPPAPDRLTAVAARVRRQRIVTSALAATAAAVAVVAVAGVAGAVLAEPPARRDPTATQVASASPAPSSTVASSTPAPGPRFEATTEVVDAPDGPDRPTEVTMAGTAGATIWLTYLRITAPQGDTGELLIVTRGTQVRYLFQLANIRDFDVHVGPAVLVEGPIVVRMTCVTPGRPATACRATVHVSGTSPVRQTAG